ncbi:hypothetical protein [Fredinandcohnia sp. 179-A 10B2 NHS]
MSLKKHFNITRSDYEDLKGVIRARRKPGIEVEPAITFLKRMMKL